LTCVKRFGHLPEIGAVTRFSRSVSTLREDQPIVQPGLQSNASAFYFLNRVDPDCGTTFSWVTRAMVLAVAAGVTAEAVLVDANPVGALEMVMEQRKPRMLVVGYGQTGRIQAALFGAVAHRLVERTDVPVLVVP